MLLERHSMGNPVKTKHAQIEFWESMEESLVLPKSQSKSDNEFNVNSNLVKYIKLSTDCYKEDIKSDQDLFRMSLLFTESELFKSNKNFCISKLLSLLNIDLLEMNMKFIIVYILLFESKRDVNSLEIMLQYQGFNVFYNTLYTALAYIQKYGAERGVAEHQITNPKTAEWTEIDLNILEEMKQISTVLMELLFLVFKYGKCGVENVQIIDDFFTYFLMNSIRSDTTEDMLNNAQFKLLLALNEQYILFSKKYEIENKVFKCLLNSSVSKRFVELLLLKFNRVVEPSLQIMMCKLIYLVVTTTENNVAMNFFYLNDLNVFIDVLIRELQNVNEKQEFLRNTFLRVILPLLKNTEISVTHYRKDDLTDLFLYLSKLENICDNCHISAEHETTVRLAKRCLTDVEWMDTELYDGSSVTSNGPESIQSSLSSTPTNTTGPPPIVRPRLTKGSVELSAESLTKRKEKSKLPPPPPPPARKR
ncbi:Protein LDB17 [Nakaseomyces bracarensis]|uniref:Protein LDB17 n=1 Tax=Nakaseomyces bracarensis TaxID=273131 RepID=A0ABR4NVZ3_9SACH